MSTKPVVLIVASAFSSLALGAPVAAACQLVKVTEAPLFALGNHIATSVTLNETTQPIIVDTGAATTTLTSRAVDELKLKPDPLAKVTASIGIGQAQAIIHLNAVASVFGLGNLVYRDRSMAVNDLDFGKTPESQSIGLLGDDILSKFDVEFDFSSGKLTFYRTFQCYDSFTPWTGDYLMIPFDHHEAKVVIDVLLDQERTRAIVDTGNNVSFVSQQSSALWDVDDSAFGATIGNSTSPVNGGTSSPIRSYRFETVEVGGKTYHQMRLNVIDVDLLFGSANLGLDYWRTRKVWISYPDNWMFIADRPSAALLAHPILNEPPKLGEAKALDAANAPTVRRLAAGLTSPLALHPRQP